MCAINFQIYSWKLKKDIAIRTCNYFFDSYFTRQVLTAETEKEAKDRIIADLQTEYGKVRLIVATSTLSMGVNIKGDLLIEIYGSMT